RRPRRLFGIASGVPRTTTIASSAGWDNDSKIGRNVAGLKSGPTYSRARLDAEEENEVWWPSCYSTRASPRNCCGEVEYLPTRRQFFPRSSERCTPRSSAAQISPSVVPAQRSGAMVLASSGQPLRTRSHSPRATRRYSRPSERPATYAEYGPVEAETTTTSG